jgi:hypothetical protein
MGTAYRGRPSGRSIPISARIRCNTGIRQSNKPPRPTFLPADVVMLSKARIAPRCSGVARSHAARVGPQSDLVATAPPVNRYIPVISYLSVRITEILWLRSIECAHASVRFGPDADIFQFEVRLVAGVQNFAKMAPIHVDESRRARSVERLSNASSATRRSDRNWRHSTTRCCTSASAVWACSFSACPDNASGRSASCRCRNAVA